LLRASLRAAGVRNDINENVIRATFPGWTIKSMQQAQIPSDTRLHGVLPVHLTTRTPGHERKPDDVTAEPDGGN
jgi:hypothetical protein